MKMKTEFNEQVEKLNSVHWRWNPKRLREVTLLKKKKEDEHILKGY